MLAFPPATLAVSMSHVPAVCHGGAMPSLTVLLCQLYWVTLEVTMEEEREIVANSELSGS